MPITKLNIPNKLETNIIQKLYYMSTCAKQVQRNLQLQIEEQGRQLKMMFDMQQRTSHSLFKSQSSDLTSLNDDDHDDHDHDAPSNSCFDEVQIFIAEPLGNTHFPSKIS